jgi:protoporphyrinogen oxidase
MSEKQIKKAIIIGGGPGGLTAAYELLKHSEVLPIVLEQGDNLGGISQTIDYKGNKIDIGGHRFFSKSDRIMQWWLHILPAEASQGETIRLSYQNKSTTLYTDAGNTATAQDPDSVMLIRNRLSRILFLRKLFDYPLTLNMKTLSLLGIGRLVRIGTSYVYAQLFPIRNEKSLEDFFINRFGKVLYQTFFKDYTEKVWGTSCKELDASWGPQRIKGLSVSKAILHAIKTPFRKKDIAQKNVETSLIERFLYPKYGPGQMWQTVGKVVEEMGGQVVRHKKVIAVQNRGTQIVSVTTRDLLSGVEEEWDGDYFISTMPIKELLKGFRESVPAEVKAVSEGLQYRDFMTVGLLLNKVKTELPDTWIYVQERDVKVGRIQFFNNWSPFMVSDPNKIWVGLEYFVNEGDELWNLPDEAMTKLALDEMVKIGFIDREDCTDSVVIRMPKAYPSYTGTYTQIETLRRYTDSIENLFLIGRNGMHRYNNQDHSMLTAMVAVENIIRGNTSKENIWAVNTEQDYHEEKK